MEICAVPTFTTQFLFPFTFIFHWGKSRRKNKYRKRFAHRFVLGNTKIFPDSSSINLEYFELASLNNVHWGLLFSLRGMQWDTKKCERKEHSDKSDKEKDKEKMKEEQRKKGGRIGLNSSEEAVLVGTSWNTHRYVAGEGAQGESEWDGWRRRRGGVSCFSKGTGSSTPVSTTWPLPALGIPKPCDYPKHTGSERVWTESHSAALDLVGCVFLLG